MEFDHTPHHETTPPQSWPIMRTQEEWPRAGMSSTMSAVRWLKDSEDPTGWSMSPNPLWRERSS